MIHFISENKKRFFSVFFIVFFVFSACFFFTPSVNAENPGGDGITTEETTQQDGDSPKERAWYDFPGHFYDGMQQFIISILQTIMEFIAYVALLLIGLIRSILSYNFIKDMQVVPIGWTICRNIVNMFFILILLVISFATILRIESYGMKQLLPKFIFAALLINFSLAIGIFFIDMSNAASRTFLGSSNGSDNVFTKIVDGLGLQKSFVPQGSSQELAESMTVQDKVKMRTNTIKASFFSLIFLMLAAFFLVALVCMLVARIIIISILLMVAPVAWLFSILPITSSHWRNWWHSFFKWTFFSPVVLFFLYVSALSLERLNGAGFGSQVAQLAQTYTKPLNQTGANITMPQIAEPASFLNYIILMGLLWGGLIAAQKLSIAGASTFVGLGKKASGWAQGVLLGGAATLSGYNALQKYRKDKKEKNQKYGQYESLTHKAKEYIPGNIGREARADAKAAVVSRAQELKKRYSPEELKKMAGRRTWYRSTNKRSETTAAALALGEMDQWKKGVSQISPNERKRLADLESTMNKASTSPRERKRLKEEIEIIKENSRAEMGIPYILSGAEKRILNKQDSAKERLNVSPLASKTIEEELREKQYKLAKKQEEEMQKKEEEEKNKQKESKDTQTNQNTGNTNKSEQETKKEEKPKIEIIRDYQSKRNS